MKKLICLALSLLILMSVFTAYALSYDELLQKADEYTAAGDYEKAFACYDLAVKSDPTNATAYIKAAMLHLERGEVSAASESIEKALFIDATSPDAWLVKCRLDVAIEDVAAFDTDALYAEICGADLSGYAADIGEMYAKAGNAEKAVESFSQVPVDNLNDRQKATYRRALISCGEKEKAAALGLDAARTRNEKLDAAFDSGNPTLSETGSATIKPQASDFEIPDDIIAAWKESGNMNDFDTSLSEGLGETEFVLLSKSPAGNSGFISAGDAAVIEFHGKYHLAYPSTKGVPDQYSNMENYVKYFYTKFRSLIGEEGIAYSPDGRYAAICNKRITLTQSKLFLDPILIDLSTGELILTATYPNKVKDDNVAAITSAVFSSDNRYFYYVLYGRFEGGRIRLCRYDLNTGETEVCLESEKNLYYPHLAELEDGSLLIINDCYRTGETEGLVTASCKNGVWSLEETKLKLSRDFYYSNQLKYSPNSGLVCLLGNTGSNSSVSFQIINPNTGFEGIDQFWCIKKDTNEIVALSPEEFQASIDTDIKNGGKTTANLSILYPYQTILNAVFSPDGNYLFLHTLDSSATRRSRNLFLIRLEDMTLQKVSGLDAEKIRVGSLGLDYPMNIEWNTDELIIGTDDGVKTFEFTPGN